MGSVNPQTHTDESKPLRSRRINSFLLVLLWLALFVPGFLLAKNYVDTSMRAIQETNALHAQTLLLRLDVLQQKVEEIEEALAGADHSLSKSSVVQEELNQRITQLDQQLEKLEQSLNTLREDNNAVSE